MYISKIKLGNTIYDIKAATGGTNTTYKFTIGTTTNGDSTNGVDLGTLKSETAVANGTTLSLVTTGEKAAWNAKTANTGTVTKVTAGTGLTGGDITTTGTIALATSGVTAGTYKRVTVDSYGRVTAGDNTDANDDTKNTTGTSNKTGTKMYLAAATEQSANPVTYSNSNCYIGTDNCLYSGGSKVLTSYSEQYTGTVTGVTVGTGGTNYTPSNGIVTIPAYPTTLPASDVSSWAKASSKPSYSYSEISGTPSSLPASDVSAWAKAANKPSYAYSEIGYTVNATSSAGGTLSLAGTTPLHVVTLTGNVSAVTLSANPAEGHSCHVIFTAASAQTVAIAHDSTNRVCPGATDLSLDVPAGGYVEVDFLTANSKVYVRGV